MKLRHKLIIWFGALILAPVMLVGAGLIRLERGYLYRENESQLVRLRGGVEKAARDSVILGDDTALISHLHFLMRQHEELDSATVRWTRAGKTRELSVGGPQPRPVNPQPRRRLMVSVHEPRRGVAIHITLFVDEQTLHARVETTLERLREEIMLVMAGALMLALLAAGILSWILTRQIDELAAAAQKIGAGNLSVRIHEHGNDEIASLVSTFNRMVSRLGELDQMKRDFVSSVTHELRSPLGAIQSFVTLLPAQIDRDGRVVAPERLRDYLGRIESNIRRLTQFINDLLDVSKIEAGKMTFTMESVDLCLIAADVVVFFEARAAELGVRLEADMAPRCPPIWGDSERLRQVLVNLVSNALKFTPRGGRVTVRVSPGPVMLDVSVSDTGAGIPPASLPHLFGRFAQVHGQARNSGMPHGTGLGLYIVKSILDRHGGRIEVRSRPGEGSEFSFHLPHHKPAGDRPAAAQEAR